MQVTYLKWIFAIRESERTGSNFLMGESGIYSIEIVLYWPEIAKIDGFKAISTNSGLNMSIIFVI